MADNCSFRLAVSTFRKPVPHGSANRREGQPLAGQGHDRREGRTVSRTITSAGGRAAPAAVWAAAAGPGAAAVITRVCGKRTGAALLMS